MESSLQRFLQHVLPLGFVKVRYFGFFGATLRSQLAWLQQRLGGDSHPQPSDETNQDTTQAEVRQKILCPKCGQPMLFQRDLSPIACLSP